MLKMEGCERNSIEGREYLEFGLLSRLDKRINDITSETSGGQQKKMSIAGLIVRIMKETGMLKSYNEAISLGLSHDKAMEEAKYSVGPVLVLIDETFNGLDSGANGGAFEYSSKGLVLKTLKASLPASAIVVSVEHQPQFDQYDARIHLNGDGTYIYSGNRATEVVPEETEDLEPLEGM
jgi:ABC-type multidrug transport system ATPase subunit